MNNLLIFLNTATIDSLTKIHGITSPLAEALIAGRPYETMEDCLKVRGMGKNLLARMQAEVEEFESSPKQIDLIPVEQEAMPIEMNQPVNKQAVEGKPPFSSRLGTALLTFLRALFRLILVVLLMGGVGAAIYFGLPLLRERFIAPVEQNTRRVAELENEVADLKIQLGEINQHMDGMNTSIEAHTASLEKLTSVQLALETQLTENNDESLLKLKQEVMMTRALDMLARARLYLAQSNFGLAREDVQSARDVLAELQTGTEDDVLAQAIARLDLTLSNLPSFPVVASGDLEIAWQILMSGEAPATATLPPEPSPTFTTTPEPKPEGTATATP